MNPRPYVFPHGVFAVMPRQRKPATPADRKTVKCTVVLDVDTHTKLAAAAALRGCDRSTIAAEAIRSAVGSIVVFDRADRRRSAGHGDPDSGEVSAA